MNAANRKRNWMMVAVTGLCVAMPALGQAKAGGEAKPAPKPMQAFIAVEHVALSEMLQDPKDAALKKALGMFPARLNELPGEIPDMPEQIVPVIDSLSKFVTRPGRFAITYTPNFAAGGAMGYGLILSSRFSDKAGADALETQVLELISEENPGFEATESERFPSLTEVVIPVAPIRFGSREGKNGSSYDVVWGAVTDADAPFTAIPKPTLPGKNLVNGSMNFEALGAIVNMGQSAISGAMQNSGQAPVQFSRELAEWGLVGMDAMQMHFESSYVDGAVRSRATLTNVEKLQEQMGTDTGGLSAADLAAIPAEATSASMTLLSTKPLLKLIGALKARFPEAQEALDQFHGMTDVDLETDLLATVGGVMGFYTSETTGGGGPGSMVLLMSFADRAKFLEAHGKLGAAARGMLENGPEEMQMAGKYVRLRTWKSGANEVMSVTFPGVPVPLEISYAATDRWFVVGLTPQAVVGALAQIEGKGDKGIATRAEVAAQMPKGKEIVSVSFSDTARSVKDGYTIASMAGSAVANAMRSPSDPSREPGIIVPSYKDLVKGVKSKVEVSYREGSSVIVDGIADPSMLVGMASAMGSMNFGSILGQMAAVGAEGMGQGRGMDFNMLPLQDRIAQMTRGVASGTNILMSPEQWVLWTGVMLPEGAHGAK